MFVACWDSSKTVVWSWVNLELITWQMYGRQQILTSTPQNILPAPENIIAFLSPDWTVNHLCVLVTNAIMYRDDLMRIVIGLIIVLIWKWTKQFSFSPSSFIFCAGCGLCCDHGVDCIWCMRTAVCSIQNMKQITGWSTIKLILTLFYS